MFDVSFSELVLILIVGLIVFGPEKLPEVVRTAGLWIGKLRRSFNNIRSEIEREVGVEELRRDLHNQAIMDSLKGVQDDLRGATQEIERLPYEIGNSIGHETPAARPAVASQGIAGESAAATTDLSQTATANTPDPTAPPATTEPVPRQHHSS